MISSPRPDLLSTLVEGLLILAISFAVLGFGGDFLAQRFATEESRLSLGPLFSSMQFLGGSVVLCFAIASLLGKSVVTPSSPLGFSSTADAAVTPLRHSPHGAAHAAFTSTSGPLAFSDASTAPAPDQYDQHFVRSLVHDTMDVITYHGNGNGKHDPRLH